MNGARRWLNAILATTALASALSLATTSKAAAADAEVEALQMPAWLTREGKRQPLTVGAQLRNGDTITTGEGSRALLRLADGSVVKLGENAHLDLNGMSQTGGGDQKRFSASLGVQQGAFRFTTPSQDKSRSARRIDVKFPMITATVVGTDIWGKSTSEQELVALIDGKINVTRKGEAPIAMTEAKTVYIAPRDGPPPPVTTITLAQLNAFAQETELQPGSGVAGRAGNYKIYAARTPSQAEAFAVYERLRDAGYAAAIQPALSGGKQIYQVRIVGILSEADGVVMAVKLRVQLGLQDVQVSLN
jgi:hypothetical protein